jgi:putative nucleotidyltransferase with HDIG domain
MSTSSENLLAGRLDGMSDRQLYAKRFHELLFGVIRSLTSAIDARDPYTRGHSERVARIASQLGRQMGMTSKEKSNLYLAGLLHDVGKIGIDDGVLKKPGKLTPDEYKHIMSHVEIGVSIVQEIRPLRHLLPAIKHHHERYDGRGYPCGLKGEDIPMQARIMAVADGFDAMFNDRAYRPRRSASEVQNILREESGRQWDSRVVSAAFDSWVELTSIQDRGLGTSLRFAVERALPMQDSTMSEVSRHATSQDSTSKVLDRSDVRDISVKEV